MKYKSIKLTETDLINVIKRVLNEQSGSADLYIDRISRQKLDQPSPTNKTPQVLPSQNINPKNLKFGDKGDDVKILQQKLFDLGVLKTRSMKPTGYFGKLTRAALQRALGKSKPNITDPKKTNNKKTSTTKKTSSGNSKTKSNTFVSTSTNPSFVKLISPKKLNTSSSTAIFPAGQDYCAQFVNDFSNKFGYIGDAWIAHNNDNLGSRVFSSFTNLSSAQVKQAIDLWTKIDNNGGGEQKGPFTNNVKQFVNQLVPSSPSTTLKLDDIVGIYYPKSGYHEKAFYDAGKPYFTEGPNGKMVPGKTIKSGKGWGMNTHLGIVGAVKDGVPIIFHNIHGQVYADPVGNLRDGGRVAWVRRPGNTTSIALVDKTTDNYI